MIRPIKDGTGNLAPPTYMSTDQFKYFLDLPMDAIDQDQVLYIRRCADYWLQGLAPNQPIRMNGDTLAIELGYGSFQEGRAAWEAIK
jgi:hypothetical protein